MATPASTALWAPVEARLPVGEVPPPLPPVDEVPPVPEPVEPESVAEAEALTESDGDGVVVGVMRRLVPLARLHGRRVHVVADHPGEGLRVADLRAVGQGGADGEGGAVDALGRKGPDGVAVGRHGQVQAVRQPVPAVGVHVDRAD